MKMNAINRIYRGFETHIQPHPSHIELPAWIEKLDDEIGGFYQHLFRSQIIHSRIPIRYINAKADFDVISLTHSTFIQGATGTGKTHLACAILREMISQNLYQHWKTRDVESYLHTVFVSLPEFFQLIRDTFNRVQDDKEKTDFINEKFLNIFTNYEWIVLDDLGVQKPTEWVVEMLYVYVEQRYVTQRPIILTSNLSLDEIALRYDDRIASRIREMCTHVQLEGRDRRLG